MALSRTKPSTGAMVFTMVSGEQPAGARARIRSRIR